MPSSKSLLRRNSPRIYRVLFFLDSNKNSLFGKINKTSIDRCVRSIYYIFMSNLFGLHKTFFLFIVQFKYCYILHQLDSRGFGQSVCRKKHVNISLRTIKIDAKLDSGLTDDFIFSAFMRIMLLLLLLYCEQRFIMIQFASSTCVRLKIDFEQLITIRCMVKLQCVFIVCV